MRASEDQRSARPTHGAETVRTWARRLAFALARALHGLRLAGLAFRAYERLAATQLRGEKEMPTDGLAVPPPHLRVLVAGGRSQRAFLSSGAQAAASIRAIVDASGQHLTELDAVLDFGVGCGRIARHWPSDGPAWHGSDHDERLVAWCQGNLAHLQVTRNGVAPPTGYGDASFDLVYAISVFTHLDEELQHRWLAEMQRLLRPGGRLIFTTHGDAFRGRLRRHEAQRYERDELVVRFAAEQGSNLCSAFHPRGWVTQCLGRSLGSIEFIAAGAPGLGRQDIWIARP